MQQLTTDLLIDRVSLRDQVVGIMRQRIVSGELRPGSIYSVSLLARELGVSNSPVREAMLELQNRGLVSAVPNRGFCVVKLTERERADVLEVRMMLEVPAMTRLADAGMPAAIAGFRPTADEIMAAADGGDIVAFLEADRRFHLGLTGLLGNAQLVETIGDLRDRTRLFADKSAVLRSAREHLDLLDLLENGNAKGAGRAMAAHLEHVLSDWKGTPATS
ncbi:GntR family transcriptional regulator [Microbacterium paludicola]|nr:GntR family transcriptional regulator [Microbacterium paludicola]MBF0817177.1 GntR family transcriptional regulator [Microbacterium paludicola]